MKKSILFVVLFVAASAVRVSSACDVCATCVAIPGGEAPGVTSISLYNQYSEIDTPPAGGHSYSEYNLQAAITHSLGERWSVSGVVPYMDKTLDDETESGIGDATLAAIYRVIQAQAGQGGLQVDVYAGVTVPTGDTAPLEEERDTYLENQEHEGEHHHHAHGHHVALGSGSVDALAGTSLSLTKGSVKGMAEAQYRLTTEGDYDFEYGDTINARLGVEYALVDNEKHAASIGVDGTLSWRDENTIMGDAQEGSNGTTAYVGPTASYDSGSQFQSSLAWDFPVNGEGDGLDGAADMRVRANLGWQF
jgi:hypothetical protein